jgi:two-component system, NarL family, sensor kinase
MHTPEDKLFYILIAATVIVGGVIGYFLFSMVRQFRHYRKLQDNSNQAKIEALDTERQTIAADLHDDIGPLLSATLFKLGEIEPVGEREKALLQESRQHIDSIYSRIRDLSSMLAPHSIERKGPLFALEEFKELYGDTHSLDVEVFAVSCKGLSPSHSLHLFRMLQEIFHNAVRHSKADHLVITSEVNNGKLVIYASDDGIGYDLHAIKERRGLGLQNLEIRARMIGASLRTESFPGKGTKHRIEIELIDKN